MMETQKPVKCLVLDTGPVIKNSPAVSSIIAYAESVFTTPDVISEIKDVATRSRVETLLLPFLTLRSPYPDSIKVVTEFARKTGDLSVLSRPDIQILALAYELECEKNGGNWRLRSVPGQKRLNGSPSGKAAEEVQTVKPAKQSAARTLSEHNGVTTDDNDQTTEPFQLLERNQGTAENETHIDEDVAAERSEQAAGTYAQKASQAEEPEVALPGVKVIDGFLPGVKVIDRLANLNLSAESEHAHSNQETDPKLELHTQENEATSGSDSSDSEGWITPSNIKKQQAKDATTIVSQSPEPKTMQVATLTTDFAMQNVLLQMNLNLLSPSLQRVRHLKTYILRCHACFQQTKDMSKQFCPRCGKPTLTRVACSTNQNGEFKLHLKANMQWNTRGDRYSIPKPVPGSANGRVNVGGGGKGGGKGGWGQELILAEDQKEYSRAISQQKRQKQRDLMDEDYLPSILTGDRGRTGGRPRVGAGRNVNSKKR